MNFKQCLIFGGMLMACLAFTNGNPTYLKQKPYDLGYVPIVPEQEMKDLNMIGYVDKHGVKGKTVEDRLHGKILRVIRFKNITDKVEEKYNLPKNLILAMVMHETGGADLIINGSNDGGAGLCHMQPEVATDFGLRTYQNCRDMVNFAHGAALRKLIGQHQYDRKQLIKYDDRFHPILNLDAVGRILAFHKQRTPVGGLTAIQMAVRGYSGTINYSTYWKKVKYYQQQLNNSNIYLIIEKKFNILNPNLKIGEEQGNYQLYVQTHQAQNYNYGLGQYR